MTTPQQPFQKHQDHQYQQQYAGPPQQYGVPPIIINNSSSASSSASAAAVAGGWRGRRRQSFWAHFWLFMCTAGIGNVIYAWSVSSWNRKHGF